MEYILETKSLSKKYGNFIGLDNLNMKIPKGAIYGFVGKNGSGKTTLIRLICGLQKPSSGEFILYGVKNLSEKIEKARHRIGAVVESPAIFSNMTAKENILYQYKVMGIPKDDRAEEILKIVGLCHTKNKKVKNFSLGMRQRLAIAISLVGNPDFLILDEPINGLDPQGIIEIRELILKLNRQKAITILISSHILDELSRIATCYGFIDNGHMIKEMTAEELFENCRKSIGLNVSDTKILARVLDKLNLEYKIIDDNNADIYGEIQATKLIENLSKENCIVYSMKEKDESIESFYMNLLGGSYV